MRTKNTFKNGITSLICNSIALIIGFLAQSVFVNTLGIEYSGLNSVFSNIISMLAISELGIGTAIIYHMYKPVSENDIDKIKNLMNFYKKAYRYIAFIVLLLGIILIPFLKFVVNFSYIKENIYIIYLLFLFDSFISYFSSYKRSLIYANQKNRIVDIIHLIYLLILNIFQILILINTKNFILYLIIKVLCRILENIIITCMANKIYPFLKEKVSEKLDKDTKLDIKQKVKGQIFHSIGGYIVLGTDSLIISKFFGLNISGIYGNYILIINAANSILSQFFNSLVSSIGNLLVEKNNKKSYNIYKTMNLINFYIYGVVAIVFYFTINDFITIWLGSNKFLFGKIIIIFLTINLFYQGMRKTSQIFLTAGGICYENRFVPVVEAIVNIVASLVFIRFGVAGVVLGTITSTLILHFYSFPKYLISNLLKEKKREYFINFIKQNIIMIVTFILLIIIDKYINIYNIFINMIVMIIICVIVSLIIFTLFYYRTKEFKFIKNIIIKFLNSKKLN